MRFLICNLRDSEQLEIETMRLGRRRRQLRFCTEALGSGCNILVMQNLKKKKKMRVDKSLKEDAKRKSVRFGWRVKI